MSAGARVGAFLAGLAAVFALAFGIGALVGPTGAADAPAPVPTTAEHADHPAGTHP